MLLLLHTPQTYPCTSLLWWHTPHTILSLHTLHTLATILALFFMTKFSLASITIHSRHSFHAHSSRTQTHFSHSLLWWQTSSCTPFITHPLTRSSHSLLIMHSSNTNHTHSSLNTHIHSSQSSHSLYITQSLYTPLITHSSHTLCHTTFAHSLNDMLLITLLSLDIPHQVLSLTLHYTLRKH